MQVSWKDHIVSTPDVLKGKPGIKGTRIPVSLILGYLAAGNTFEDIIKEFLNLTHEQLPRVWIMLGTSQSLRLPSDGTGVLRRSLFSAANLGRRVRI